MSQTKLESVAIKVFNLKNRGELIKKITQKQITQKQLDRKTEQILNQLTPQDRIDHTKTVYNRTASDFNVDDHIQGIVDELIVFMEYFNENDLILDLGCGNGRDTLFMTTNNSELRKSLMNRVRNGKKTIEKYQIPTKTLKVIALDSSKEMLRLVFNNIVRYTDTIQYYPILVQEDMHSPLKSLDLTKTLDGIWSCTSLLVHTPQELIKPAIKLWANCLKPNGKFYLSYINEKVAGGYDKLMASSTGYIKYFSHPDPDKIRKIAEKCGLQEIYFRLTDFPTKDKLIKHFFANHIFEKRKK